MDKDELELKELAAEGAGDVSLANIADDADGETPLDKNIKLMSPMRMVLRRFFRSKLSIAGIIMLAFLIVFSWLGPVVYDKWGEIEVDRSGTYSYTVYDVETEDGSFVQMIVTHDSINALAPPSSEHILGTDEQGMDVFTRLMYGGRLSLTLSFLAVFLTSFIGIVLGGIAGFYGGVVDNVIMRLCDILMCFPTLPLMLILGTVLDANGVPAQYYIYLLMGSCRYGRGRAWRGWCAGRSFTCANRNTWSPPRRWGIPRCAASSSTSSPTSCRRSSSP